MSAPIEILILGGNFGGVSAVHSLIKQTIPSLKKVDSTKSYHITLVTPNTNYFFKIAAPRVLINSTLIPVDKILRPLAGGFAKYTSEQLTLVQGVATGLDGGKKSVTVNTSGATKELPYDFLILATGTTSASPLWTLHNDQSLTTSAFKSLWETLPKAKTVLIAGGGAVGVETAGEISHNYPKAKVTLLSGGTRILPKTLPATAARGQNYLEKHQHVEVIHNVRVVSSTTTGSSTTVTLSDGSTKTVDVYIDATGGAPNSQYVPSSWLDESGRVITNDKFGARGASTGDEAAKGIYVLGDLVAGSANTAMVLDAQMPVVLSAISIEIVGAGSPPSLLQWLLPGIFGGSKLPVQKPFKPLKNTMVIPIGPNGGVGEAFGWKMPSAMVKMAKGAKYLVEMAEPAISGTKWKAVA